jgi:hypothetical protein
VLDAPRREHAKTTADREIVQEIYDRHYESFRSFSKERPNRSSKILVPVDLPAIAEKFSVDVDIIFGRLYYCLNHKFGYEKEGGARISLFTPKAGNDANCVNLPLLAPVLAGMREEHSKRQWAFCLSIASLVVSIIAIVIHVVS